MIILGIDPGVARVGWGVVKEEKARFNCLAFGCITTEANIPLEMRLKEIHTQLGIIIKKNNPDTISIEELFFSNNAKTAMSVGQARGVVLLAAAQANIPVVSYTPLTVKQTICATGTAQKTQVQRMVKTLLRLTTIPEPDDTADALAIALTCAFSYKLKQKLV